MRLVRVAILSHPGQTCEREASLELSGATFTPFLNIAQKASKPSLGVSNFSLIEPQFLAG